jgi:hypothetical protein
LPDCGLAAVAQRIPDHAVPVFGKTTVRDEVIGAVDVYRVDGVGIDEFGDIDRIGRLETEFLEIGRLDRYIPALLVLVALDDLTAVDRPEPRHHILIAHTLARRFVYPAEVDALLFGGRRIEAHRDRHQR